MKFTFFWLFFLSFCFIQNTAFAQSDTNLILTLKERLENVSTVEEEVGLLNDIAWEYYYQNFDSAMYYTNLALAKSDELEDEYWQSVSLEMKAILMEMSGQYEEAISLYLEVIPLRQKSGGEGLENTYNNMAALFQNQQNYETSLIYFKKSLEIEEERNNQNGIAACLINLGISYKNLGKLDTAGVLFRQANILSEAIKDSVLMIHSSLSLGDYFYQDNKKDSATYS
ncbi:tetratricopeptide repeat protein, partial [uncultured Algoriphagus sp.]|uniref:tetratricopeptide repeat protein n=1 Tax=uncultured Algoriphagus sp. TaxID=417365 RepID=UPI002598FC7A